MHSKATHKSGPRVSAESRALKDLCRRVRWAATPLYLNGYIVKRISP